MSLSITVKSHQPEESLDLMLLLVNRHFSRIQAVLETALPLMLRDHQDVALFVKSLLLNTALSCKVIEKAILNPVEVTLQQYGCGKPRLFPQQVERSILDADYALLTELKTESKGKNRVHWEPHHLSLSAWEDSVCQLFKQYERDERFEKTSLASQIPSLTGQMINNNPSEYDENLSLRIKYFLFDIKIRVRTVLTYAVLAAAANVSPAARGEEKKSA